MYEKKMRNPICYAMICRLIKRVIAICLSTSAKLVLIYLHEKKYLFS